MQQHTNKSADNKFLPADKDDQTDNNDIYEENTEDNDNQHQIEVDLLWCSVGLAPNKNIIII